MLLTVRLFEERPDILERWQDRFRYIHVDEYQDTNPAQYHLTRLLAQKYQNVCVVGDDDQSIYSWRGADIRNILDFERDYPQTTVIHLSQNYRCTQTILDAAQSVVRFNRRRRPKELFNPERGRLQDSVLRGLRRAGRSGLCGAHHPAAHAPRRAGAARLCDLLSDQRALSRLRGRLPAGKPAVSDRRRGFAFTSGQRSRICSPTFGFWSTPETI
ncbi:MAG: hypothetical protein KatS3mg115_1310 [Candidatus Poribacteria bacterium]|nr:MAG: hypothetical protein KatS3mg115_1310 [Candidatus Poribacteria bacterium]